MKSSLNLDHEHIKYGVHLAT